MASANTYVSDTWVRGTLEEIHKDLSRNWWAVALRGVFGIAFGLTALLMPVETMLSLVILFAAYMLADGVFAIIASFKQARAGRPWGWLTAEGIVNIFTAAAVTAWPDLTVMIFIIIIATWALVSGGLAIAAGISLKHDHGRLWLAGGGFVSVLYGALLIVAPMLGAIVLTWWIGAYALAFGLFLLLLALQLRTQHNKSRV